MLSKSSTTAYSVYVHFNALRTVHHHHIIQIVLLHTEVRIRRSLNYSNVFISSINEYYVLI